MASCVGCKKRTTSFCYVHKTSVCDDCTALKGAGLAAPPAVQCQPHDVIGNYFDWLADGDFTWPPRCPLCNLPLSAEPSSVCRLVCKHTLHRDCMREHLANQLHVQRIAAKDLKCPAAGCQLLLVDPATQPRTKLREAVAAMLQQAVQGGAGGGAGAVPVGNGIAAPGEERKESASSLATTTSGVATAASPSGSAGAARSNDSRYSSAVRDLMNQAASARAAAPAGTAHTAIALERPGLDPGSARSSTTSASAYGPEGAVSRGAASVLTPSNSSAAASSSSLPFASLISSSSSRAGGQPDLEAGGASDAEGHADLKGHKTPRSRFAMLRHAAQSGGWRRLLSFRPQRVVLSLMLLAVICMIGLYLYAFVGGAATSDLRSSSPSGGPDALLAVQSIGGAEGIGGTEQMPAS